jgi:hypothetical protein
MRADLHVHSTASDGTCTPEALVELALGKGLSVLAVADHDSVEGTAEAIHAAHGTSLSIVPAVELSAVGPDGSDVHVLGYFIDVTDAHLLSHLADLRIARERRAATIVSTLTQAGYPLDLEDVMSLSGGGAIGRSHIARALVVAGHAQSVPAAFQTLIGRNGSFYIPKDVRGPEDVIACIDEAGGFAVLAHPGSSKIDGLIAGLIDSGLRGIEAYHSDHTPEQQAHYAALGAELGLLVTGGSDYHGPAAPNPELGSVDIPEHDIIAFLAAGGV